MRKRLLMGILAVAAALACSGRVAEASIILSYRFNGDGEAQLVCVESALADELRLSIQGGEGLAAILVGGEAADGSQVPVLRLIPIGANSADAAMASEAYLVFTFEADEKPPLGPRTLEFDVSKTGESAEFGCFVQSSLGGFGSDRPTLAANPVATGGAGKIHYSVDLSDERFQDLGSVDFRVYFYSSATDEPLVFDGIQLRGEVLVAPEPSGWTVWLLLATLALCLTGAWWGLRGGTARLACASTGSPGTTTFMAGTDGASESRRGRQPWTEDARTAILDIIDRGRLR